MKTALRASTITKILAMATNAKHAPQVTNAPPRERAILLPAHQENGLLRVNLHASVRWRAAAKRGASGTDDFRGSYRPRYRLFAYAACTECKAGNRCSGGQCTGTLIAQKSLPCPNVYVANLSWPYIASIMLMVPLQFAQQVLTAMTTWPGTVNATVCLPRDAHQRVPRDLACVRSSLIT